MKSKKTAAAWRRLGAFAEACKDLNRSVRPIDHRTMRKLAGGYVDFETLDRLCR